MSETILHVRVTKEGFFWRWCEHLTPTKKPANGAAVAIAFVDAWGDYPRIHHRALDFATLLECVRKSRGAFKADSVSLTYEPDGSTVLKITGERCPLS